MKTLLPALALLCSLTAKGQKENYLIVGTYTGGKSEGIYVYKFNSQTGTTEQVNFVKISNPSFIAISPDERYIYAVSENGKEGKGGEVSAFSFNKKTGSLTFLNKQFTGGDHPCYTDTDKTGKWIFAGNYSSGNLSVLPVLPDGSLGKTVSVITHTGSGPNKSRQAAPHVHCTIIASDNKWLYVPDLGIDKVMIYSFDAVSGELKTGSQPFASSTPGSGPRHLTFHPNGRNTYLIEELTGHIVVYQMNNGQLKQLQRISSLPPNQKGYAGSADIHVSLDGKFLYASNRGDFNNIAIYKINAPDGKLSLTGFQSTLGNTPRNFNLDPSGNFLLVANQDSDEIVIFKRNKKTGMLLDTRQRISVGKPVCLKWIAAE